MDMNIDLNKIIKDSNGPRIRIVEVRGFQELGKVYEGLTQQKVVLVHYKDIDSEVKTQIQTQLQHICSLSNINMDVISEDMVSIDPLLHVEGVVETGWLSVNYEDTAIYSSQRLMERGYGEEPLHELLKPFHGKEIKLMVTKVKNEE